MANIERRIEKLEGMYKPQSEPRPSLVMLDATSEPVNGHYAEVLRMAQEARARGEYAPLAVLRLPAQELRQGVKQEVEQ